MTPEGKAKRQMKVALATVCAEHNAKLYLQGNAGSQFGIASVDFTGALWTAKQQEEDSRPYAIAIEVKRFDIPTRLTMRQQHTLKTMRRCGVCCFEVNSEFELNALLHWVESACCE